MRACVMMVAALTQPALSGASEVTPMGKVMELIEGLKKEVEAEGKEEAKTYEKFACFCKDTTMGKSKSIEDGKDSIDVASATIESSTAEKKATETELQERKDKHEQLAAELKDSEVECAKEKAAYEERDADLTKSISGLNGALDSLSAAKPASFIAVRESIKSSLSLAAALGMSEKAQSLATSALSVDPNDPEYKYHSQGILDIIHKLLKEYQETKSDADAEWEKTSNACKKTQESLAQEIEANEAAMKEAKEKIETLKGKIAENRKNLLESQSLLKDDQAYLKDLTERCEERANDWDQRSKLRSDELTALTQAYDILNDRAKPMDEAANARALLQSTSTQEEQGSPSFLQRAGLRSHSSRQRRAAALLGAEGTRLHSSVLSSLSQKLTRADPFGKINALIQELIERLIKEATEEATKKGFCDTEMGKAEKDRDYRLADVKKLNTKIAGLELKRAELEEEIEHLTGTLEKLNEDLETADEDRKEEKEVNLKTIADAKEGLVAVNEAINVLKAFYKNAAKATVLAQASPVDEDTEGAGFKGAYKGNQKQATGIIGMLEVIKSDFERTLKHTEASEKKSSAEFVKFDRTSKTDIGGKDTKKELDEEDLATTKDAIQQGMADLKTQMGLLDKALETIEELKPTCIDTTMSYEERVAKREEEMSALRKALCILDTDKVEADCSA